MSELQELRNIREELLTIRTKLYMMIDEVPLGHIAEGIASMVYDSVDKACLDLEVLSAVVAVEAIE